jgi:RsiW-degrading membrane proteinase PrsW (M82 family)
MVAHILAAAAIVPSFLLVWYFHGRDLYPEPGRVIWATFGLGGATIPAVLLVAVPLSVLTEQVPDVYVAGFLGAFLTAAIPEELFKLLVLRRYCVRHPEFTSPMDGVVYGAVVSLGFATLENVLYVATNGFGVAAIRAITAVPAHAFMGAIMGYYVGRAKFHPNERRRAQRMAYVIPILLHGLYDYPVLTLEVLRERGLPPEDGAHLLPITLAVFLTTCVWALRGVRRARADQAAPAASPSARSTILGPGTAEPVPASGAPRGHHNSLWIVGTALLLLGLVLATGGAIVLLRVVTAMTSGQLASGEQDQALVGNAIVGVLPLILGFALFGLGIRSLNRSSLPAPRRS